MMISMLFICTCPPKNRAEAMRYFEAAEYSDPHNSEKDQLQGSVVCEHCAAGRTAITDNADDDQVEDDGDDMLIYDFDYSMLWSTL